MPDWIVGWRRTGLAALVGVGLIVGVGWLAECWWLGTSADASYARVRTAVQGDFLRTARALQSVARGLAAHPDVIPSLGQPATRGRLFEITRDHVARSNVPEISITVLDAGNSARAWTGRPSNVSLDTMPSEALDFVSSGDRDLRLVHVEPLTVRTTGDPRPRRVGAVVAEHIVSPSPSIVGSSFGGFRLSTPIADVTLRPYDETSTAPSAYRFRLDSLTGVPLLEGEVLASELDDARDNWRRLVLATATIFLAVLVAMRSVHLITRRPQPVTPRQRPDVLAVAASASAGYIVAFLLLRYASILVPFRVGILDESIYRSSALSWLLRHPVDLLLTGVWLLALVLVATFVVEHTRLSGHPGQHATSDADFRRYLSVQCCGGVLATVLIWGLDRLLDDTFHNASVDLLHTSLQPWDSGRVSLLAGVLLVSSATFWGMTLTFSATRLPWSTRPHTRRRSAMLLTATVWIAPSVACMLGGLIPPLATTPLLGGAVLTALAMPSARPRFRHGSQAGRTLALLATLLVPAVLTYPTLLYHGEETKRRYVETQHVIRAAGHSEELQRALGVALTQLDTIVGDDPRPEWGAPSFDTGPDRAFELWRRTELASQRLTSSVELYSAAGQLISRFNLNLPEYGGTPLGGQVSGCEWEIFGETAPFGSDERRLLHAERALCPLADDDGTGRAGVDPGGSVVVHVAFDYQTLPFISPENPYVELLGPAPRPRVHDPAGQDIELVVYGWGLQPVFSSSQDAWSLDEQLFDRIYASRTAFWTSLTKGGRTYAAHVANNREGIYAVGYPTFRVLDHLIRLAEIATLIGLLFVLFVAASVAAGALTPDGYRLGPSLLREVRSSFYRRLLLAFIAATLIPVLALAFVIRNYVTAQLRDDVEAGAAQTAIVAQRVIEESLVQAGQVPTALLNDDLMVWISHILDQEVNVFLGSQLVATSERDLFASGLLPTRTPDAVYSAITLERLPSFVVEDSLGSLEYLVAAAPLTALGPEAVLTVPLASRQQEIERQIDDLDRGILLGVVVFVLLGAGGGLYMAERIADPVKRLTRATGQIASGDFDAHVVARSADELQQLVVSFNQMADDLKRQQVQLEKTHRLEAWADMARQVAHEIKNPLTPVQLSAEHLLRVHADRGEPLGPVVGSCVDSILHQVRLLRQISSEFSSYATQPTVERRPTSPAELVTAILEPYLVGLKSRIRVVVDVPSTLPILTLDRTLVGRALTNVIENALHAMPATGTLEVKGTTDGDGVTLTITDTGVGLDAETLRRIFEPYFSTKVTGTGLGMVIAKRNIELNGGEIAVSSQLDHGTTVSVTFPTAAYRAAGNTVVGPSPSSVAGSGSTTVAPD